MTSYKKIFKGCKNGREFVSRDNVPDNKYVFAKASETGFIVTNGLSKKFDKIYISKIWFNKQYIDDAEDEPEEIIEDAPEIINLDDSEKFVDNFDNIVEIEVRGERDCEKCYFKVKDIMREFEIKYLNDVLINKNRSGYIAGLHYKYFYFPSSVKDRRQKIKELYLTYSGLLRVFFASHKQTTDKFVNWATKTLFTAQMGTPTERKKLAANIVNPTDITAFFSKTNQVLPVIYLFTLGIVKDLRETFNIDKRYNDDQIVAKIGTTKDFERRTKEHAKSFGKLKNVKLELAQYNFIDEEYIFSAESDLKDAFGMMHFIFEHDTYKEIIIFNKTLMPKIKKQYESISKSYIGNIAGAISKIKDLENKHENELLKRDMESVKDKHEIELLKKDIESVKDKHIMEIMKKDMELMKKDMEITRLKK